MENMPTFELTKIFLIGIIMLKMDLALAAFISKNYSFSLNKFYILI